MFKTYVLKRTLQTDIYIRTYIITYILNYKVTVNECLNLNKSIIKDVKQIKK